jgi:hypothetical protein
MMASASAPLLAHRPWPPVAHSITPAVSFSSAWTSETNRSSGRIAVDFAGLVEVRALSHAIMRPLVEIIAPFVPQRTKKVDAQSIFIFTRQRWKRFFDYTIEAVVDSQSVSNRDEMNKRCAIFKTWDTGVVNCGTCKLAYMRSGIGGEAFRDADGVAM